jgi:hypothetical protein
MKRRTFDGMVTFVGFGVSIFLFIAAGLLNWGYSFANDSVTSQLSSQQITIPSATMNPKESADVTAFFKANGDKIMSTGRQAQMYADHYLGFHLSGMPTYAAASGAARSASAAAAADPNNTDLAKASASATATVDTVFKGTMLRGTLLTTYAFWQMGQIAKIAAAAMLLGGILLLIFVIAGWMHLRRTPTHATI